MTDAAKMAGDEPEVGVQINAPNELDAFTGSGGGGRRKARHVDGRPVGEVRTF